MQITDTIHAIKIPFQVRVDSGITVDRFVYVYLVYGKEICLIDTGVAGSEQAIFEYIRKTGRKPDNISMVILPTDVTGTVRTGAGRTRVSSSGRKPTGCKVV